MESKQSSASPVQLLISQNRFKCVTELSYAKIASFLISHSVLSEDQHVTIKKASNDCADRMDDLLAFLYQLNSIDALGQFRNAVIACGHADLAESLKLDDHKSHSEVDPVLNPKILAKVFAYLPKSELWKVRSVCSTWNDVICSSSWMSPTIQLKSQNDLNRYVTSKTNFCSLATNFQLSIQEFSAADRCVWTDFFQRFGNNIESLHVTKLNRGIVELIFSKDIQKLFINLIRLRLNVSLEPSFVAATPLSFLVRLKHLTVESTTENSEYGQMAFLSKFLQLDHKLESLALCRHFCIGEIPSDIPKNLFRTNTIQSFEVASQPAPFLNDKHFKEMTHRIAAPSKLQNVKFVNCSKMAETVVMHRFFVSHRYALKRITLSSCHVYLDDLPKLDALQYLNGQIVMRSDALTVCTQFPNLEELELTILGKIVTNRFTKFKHKALRSLCLFNQTEWPRGRENVRRTDDGALTALKSFISSCFPNLAKLELNDIDI